MVGERGGGWVEGMRLQPLDLRRHSRAARQCAALAGTISELGSEISVLGSEISELGSEIAELQVSSLGGVCVWGGRRADEQVGSSGGLGWAGAGGR